MEKFYCVNEFGRIQGEGLEHANNCDGTLLEGTTANVRRPGNNVPSQLFALAQKNDHL